MQNSSLSPRWLAVMAVVLTLASLAPAILLVLNRI
jgi:hypothetical protein